MSEPSSGLVILLFTDLVGSTELLARTGDTEAERTLSAISSWPRWSPPTAADDDPWSSG